MTIRDDEPAPFHAAEDLAREAACLDCWADPVALDHEMRRIVAGEAVLNLNLGAALALMKDRRFRDLGLVRWKDYLREYVDLTVPTVSAMRKRVQRLRDRPVLLRALVEGRLKECPVSLLLESLPLDGTRDAEWAEIAAGLSLPELKARLCAGEPSSAAVLELDPLPMQEWLKRNTLPWNPACGPEPSDPGPGQWWHLDLPLDQYFDFLEAQTGVGQVAGEELSRLHTLEALAANYVAGAPLPPWEPGPLPLEAPATPPVRDPRLAPDLEVLDRAWGILEETPVEVRFSEAFLREIPRHPHELQDHLDALLRCRQRLSLALSLLLHHFWGREHFRHFGFRNIAEYAAARLGLRPSTTYDLLRRESLLGRGLWNAVWDGALSVSQALLLAPFTLEDRVEAWVEFARHLTVRKLQDWAAVLTGLLEVDPRVFGPPGPEDTLDSVRALVKTLYAEKVAAEAARLDGFRAAGQMPPEALRMWAAVLVEAERERKPRWHRRPPRASTTWTFRRLPVEARTCTLDSLPEALRPWVAPLVPGGGPMALADLPPELARDLQREVGDLRGYRTSDVRRWGGLSKPVRTISPEELAPKVRTSVWVPDELKPLLDRAVETASLEAGRPLTREEALAVWVNDFQKMLTPMHRQMSRRRREIFLRQQGVCAVPGCTCLAEHEHHIRQRCHGGGDEAFNRIFLCENHHQQQLHKGRLRLRGRAPDDLTWWLGIVDGEARQIYRNDTRVAGPGMLGRRAGRVGARQTA